MYSLIDLYFLEEIFSKVTIVRVIKEIKHSSISKSIFTGFPLGGIRRKSYDWRKMSDSLARSCSMNHTYNETIEELINIVWLISMFPQLFSEDLLKPLQEII